MVPPDDERMNRDHIEQVLRTTFELRGRSAVGDHVPVPPMTAPMNGPTHRPEPAARRRLIWAVPAVLAVIAVAVVTAAVVRNLNHRPGHAVAGTAVSATTDPGRRTTASGSARSSTAAASPSTSPTTPSAASSSKPPVATRTVQVTSLENDGETYGIGLPVVMYFSPVPTNAAAFEKAVTVTVNDKPAAGAWFWEQPTRDEVDRHIVEAHYRLAHYWPADSTIHVNVPIGGLSAGHGLVYSGKLTSLDYKIGDAHITTVDASSLTMHVTSNGKLVKTAPVSLGAAATPTFNGTKIVMQKGEDVPGTDTLRSDGTVLMNGPGYSDDPVKWSVRITQSGEYLHAAPWNHGIGVRSTSNGCTNLHTDVAKWFYNFAQIGDVVSYANTDGTTMPSWDGLGDWNVNWGQWTQGGLLQ